MSNGWASIREHTSHGPYNNVGHLRRMILIRLSMVTDRIFIDEDICTIVTCFCWDRDIINVMAYKDTELAIGFKAWLDGEAGNDITKWFKRIADDYYAKETK